MQFLIAGIVIVYSAMLFLIWQMIKQAKQNQVVSSIQREQQQQINMQEQHLKQTLQMMQDLAKKMHVQQQVIDNTTARIAQLEIQNAELTRLLQQNFANKSSSNRI